MFTRVSVKKQEDGSLDEIKEGNKKRNESKSRLSSGWAGGKSLRDNARGMKNGMTNRQINGNTCISRVLFEKQRICYRVTRGRRLY